MKMNVGAADTGEVYLGDDRPGAGLRNRDGFKIERCAELAQDDAAGLGQHEHHFRV
jgi:hypothetical protein